MSTENEGDTPEEETQIVEGAADENAEGSTTQTGKDDKSTTEEEVEESSKELDTSVWGDAGNDVANSVLETLQNSGVTPEQAKALLWDAVEQGDPTKIDRDELVAKVGKANATLIMAGVNTVVRENNERIAAVKKVTATVAGSEADWTKAAAWAVKNVPADDLDELRNMLDKGGRSAKVAAEEIVELYNKDAKNSSIGKKTISPDGKGSTKLEPLTSRAFGEAIQKAYARRASPAEIRELHNRRAAGKKQGI